MKEIRIKAEDITPISDIQITKPSECISFMNKLIGDLAYEYTAVVYLNVKNSPMNYMITSIGDVTKARFDSQKILQAALLQNSPRIMLFHNHPSGSLEPSPEDISATKRIVVAASLMGVEVLDHIIVTRDDFYSFGTNGMLWISNDDYDDELQDLEAELRGPRWKTAKKEPKCSL